MRERARESERERERRGNERDKADLTNQQHNEPIRKKKNLTGLVIPKESKT